jgi:hypothetical protein
MSRPFNSTNSAGLYAFYTSIDLALTLAELIGTMATRYTRIDLSSKGRILPPDPTTRHLHCTGEAVLRHATVIV